MCLAVGLILPYAWSPWDSLILQSVILLPFYRWRNWGLKRSWHLAHVNHLGGGELPVKSRPVVSRHASLQSRRKPGNPPSTVPVTSLKCKWPNLVPNWTTLQSSGLSLGYVKLQTPKFVWPSRIHPALGAGQDSLAFRLNQKNLSLQIQHFIQSWAEKFFFYPLLLASPFFVCMW